MPTLPGLVCLDVHSSPIIGAIALAVFTRRAVLMRDSFIEGAFHGVPVRTSFLFCLRLLSAPCDLLYTIYGDFPISLMQLFPTTGKVASNPLEELGDKIFSKEKFWTYLTQSNFKDYADRSDFTTSELFQDRDCKIAGIALAPTRGGRRGAQRGGQLRDWQRTVNNHCCPVRVSCEFVR